MDKAYSIKALEQKLLEKGLPEVELLAEKVYEATKEWYSESAVLSETKVDDITLPFLNFIDNLVKPQLDKIDGQEG
jgi:hypothetical protein